MSQRLDGRVVRAGQAEESGYRMSYGAYAVIRDSRRPEPSAEEVAEQHRKVREIYPVAREMTAQLNTLGSIMTQDGLIAAVDPLDPYRSEPGPQAEIDAAIRRDCEQVRERLLAILADADTGRTAAEGTRLQVLADAMRRLSLLSQPRAQHAMLLGSIHKLLDDPYVADLSPRHAERYHLLSTAVLADLNAPAQ